MKAGQKNTTATVTETTGTKKKGRQSKKKCGYFYCKYRDTCGRCIDSCKLKCKCNNCISKVYCKSTEPIKKTGGK